MLASYINQEEFSAFSASREQLESIIQGLSSPERASQEHGEVENFIQKEGNELLRKLLQGHLDVRAATEIKQEAVVSKEGQRLNHIRCDTRRKIVSLFGEVEVKRLGYSQRNEKSVFPLDAELNLHKDQYSFGLRKQLIRQAIKGSFDESVDCIKNTTGGHVPKRQALQLVEDIAQDFNAFYEQNRFEKPENTKDRKPPIIAPRNYGGRTVTLSSANGIQEELSTVFARAICSSANFCRTSTSMLLGSKVAGSISLRRSSCTLLKT